MTREIIQNLMNQIRKSTHVDFETFYLRYTSNHNHITTNKWGTIFKFERALQEAEKSDDLIGDSLPIELLVLITKTGVHCWTKNPLWDKMNCPEEDSHVYTNVPLVGKYWFVDPKDWLDFDNRKSPAEPVSDSPAEPVSDSPTEPQNVR